MKTASKMKMTLKKEDGHKNEDNPKMKTTPKMKTSLNKNEDEDDIFLFVMLPFKMLSHTALVFVALHKLLDTSMDLNLSCSLLPKICLFSPLLPPRAVSLVYIASAKSGISDYQGQRPSTLCISVVKVYINSYQLPHKRVW